MTIWDRILWKRKKEKVTTDSEEKCIRLSVPSAERNVKFLSSHPETDLFIAGIASRSTGRKDAFNLTD